MRNYNIGANVDASATANSSDVWGNAGFVPVGNAATRYTGIFDGLGHTIANIYINLPTTNYVGLFGDAGTGSAIRNVGLVGGSVTGANNVGELAGWNFGTVSNTYTTGNVTGTNYVGGLVGNDNTGSSISNSYATGSVVGSNWVGGLVGFNNGTVSNSYSISSVSGVGYVGGLVGDNYSGSIFNSYSSGNVSGTGTSVYIGGLVGINVSTVSNSYSVSSVTGKSYIGGLVGDSTGTITNTYASGTVSGTGGFVGGLIGYNTGTISNGYWNSTVKATGVGGGTATGATGLTATQMQTAANFAGFVFTTTPGATGNNWVMVDANGTLNNAGGVAGSTLPMLASEYSITINNAHQLQLMEMTSLRSLHTRSRHRCLGYCKRPECLGECRVCSDRKWNYRFYWCVQWSESHHRKSHHQPAHNKLCRPVWIRRHGFCD